MYNYLIRRAGNGFTANCICLDASINAYALVSGEEKTYTPGTVFNFSYTGSVLELQLLRGKYKLQCWGAQGGNSYQYSGVGSKGGYSEGILTVTNPVTAYIFVGGKGANGSGSTSVANGGWNGGGGSVGKSSYGSDDYGVSYPACGGGATDIATVTSSMSYSDYTTNRSNESLLSRFIVAGGGAGASGYYHEYQTSSDSYSTVYSSSETLVYASGDLYSSFTINFSGDAGEKYESSFSLNGASMLSESFYDGSWNYVGSGSFTASSSGKYYLMLRCDPGDAGTSVDTTVYRVDTTYDTDSSSGKSNSSQQGGGTSGQGTSPGTQTSGGGSFGRGKNQTVTNYKFDSGAGGGGWYGGGSSYTDSSTSQVNASGGGSGFVNIAANSSSRPSGYTGLQLDSGSTKAGNVSFPSTSGGSETGHSGNGYARITVIDPNYTPPAYSITWATRTGTWNESSYSSAADNKKFTCVSPGSSGSTVLKCTFSGVSSITFKCRYQGESSYDYLTVGDIDTNCSRSSYKTSLKGSSGTWKELTYTCDSNEHYVEFCYSKDSSVDTSPDNAEVYISSYTQQ